MSDETPRATVRIEWPDGRHVDVDSETHFEWHDSDSMTIRFNQGGRDVVMCLPKDATVRKLEDLMMPRVGDVLTYDDDLQRRLDMLPQWSIVAWRIGGALMVRGRFWDAGRAKLTTDDVVAEAQMEHESLVVLRVGDEYKPPTCNECEAMKADRDRWRLKSRELAGRLIELSPVAQRLEQLAERVDALQTWLHEQTDWDGPSNTSEYQMGAHAGWRSAMNSVLTRLETITETRDDA